MCIRDSPSAKLDEVVGVVKAYSTCVGEGPFVCEWFGPEACLLYTSPVADLQVIRRHAHALCSNAFHLAAKTLHIQRNAIS